jgi:hypothetical protein
MFDPVTVDTQIGRLGRVASSIDMIALKRSHAAATRAAFGRATARGGIAVAAHKTIVESHERGGMKLAAVLALGQHQAASVT